MSMRIYPTHPALSAADLVSKVDHGMEELGFLPSPTFAHVSDYPNLYNPFVMNLGDDTGIRYIAWDDRIRELGNLGQDSHLDTMYMWREPSPVRRYFHELKKVKYASLVELRERDEQDVSVNDFVKVKFTFKTSGKKSILSEVYFSELDGMRATLFVLKYLVAFLIEEIASARVTVLPKHAEEDYFVYDNGKSVAKKVPWW